MSKDTFVKMGPEWSLSSEHHMKELVLLSRVHLLSFKLWLPSNHQLWCTCAVNRYSYWVVHTTGLPGLTDSVAVRGIQKPSSPSWPHWGPQSLSSHNCPAYQHSTMRKLQWVVSINIDCSSFSIHIHCCKWPEFILVEGLVCVWVSCK